MQYSDFHSFLESDHRFPLATKERTFLPLGGSNFDCCQWISFALLPTGMVAMLINLGATVNEETGLGFSLFTLAYSGYKKIAGELLNKITNDYPDIRRHLESKESSEVIEYLAGKNANVAQQGKEYFKAIFLAIKQDQLELVNFLYARDPNPNDQGVTPFQLAIIENKGSICEFFIEDDHRLNNYIDSQSGDTLLHLAVKNPQSSLVEFLIGKKADLHAKNEDGLTPLALAIANNNWNIVNCFLDSDKLKLEKCTENWADLLHLVFTKEKSSVKLLIEKMKKVASENGLLLNDFFYLLYNDDEGAALYESCLLKTQEYKSKKWGESLRQSLSRLFQALLKDPDLAQFCENEAQYGISTCGDRVIVHFRECLRALQIWEALKNPTDEALRSLGLASSELCKKHLLNRYLALVTLLEFQVQEPIYQQLHELDHEQLSSVASAPKNLLKVEQWIYPHSVDAVCTA